MIAVSLLLYNVLWVFFFVFICSVQVFFVQPSFFVKALMIISHRSFVLEAFNLHA